MVKIIKSISKMLDPEYLVQNSYLFAVLTVFLTMYGPRLQPQLPESLRNLFDNIVFRGVVLFLIGYLSSNNFQVSLIVTIIFLVTMNILHTNEVLEKFNYENFVINGPPLASCSPYNPDSFNLIGTPYYPLHDTNKLLVEREQNDNILKYENEINYN